MQLLFVCLNHLDRESPKRQFIADLRHTAGLGCDQSGDRGVIFVLELGLEEPLDLIDLGRAKNIPVTVLAIDYLNDLFLLNIFILDLADDLLENVLDSNEAGDAAVFVDDDRYL